MIHLRQSSLIGKSLNPISRRIVAVAMSTEGQLETWRQEILGYLEQMKNFRQMNVGEILRKLGAYSARASEIRMRVVRSPDKRAQSFRTQEIDPFLTEVDRQHKVWSRVASLMQTEWESSQRGS